jgi:hypothetical protein
MYGKNLAEPSSHAVFPVSGTKAEHPIVSLFTGVVAQM